MKKKAPKKKSKIVDIIVIIVFIILGIMIVLKDDSAIKPVSYGKPPMEKEEKDIPQQLRWFDNFKGIDNMNRGTNKEKPANFMEYEREKNR